MKRLRDRIKHKFSTKNYLKWFKWKHRPTQTAMRREAIVRAARIAVNCYRWQGEGRAHYLADAMENLAEAVDKFEAANKEKRVETAAI